MSVSIEDSAESKNEPAAEQETYEPPRLTRLGNVDEIALLTCTAGGEGMPTVCETNI